MIPDAPLDLPPYFANPQDVYLLITAGGAYTDIQVLANPEVSAPKVAQALSSALTGTTLQGQTVEWSSDRYSAAQVSVHHRRFGAMCASNDGLSPFVKAVSRRAVRCLALCSNTIIFCFRHSGSKWKAVHFTREASAAKRFTSNPIVS